MQLRAEFNNFANHQKYQLFKRLLSDYLISSDIKPVDVPTLSPSLIPESTIEVYKTTLKTNNAELYLTPSPELFMKRLLIYGFGDCYSIGRSYRNNEIESSRHSYEFDMLELYLVDKNYMDMAKFITKLLNHLKNEINPELDIDFEEPEMITVAEAFEKYAGITEIFVKSEFLIQADSNHSYIDTFSSIIAGKIEPNLGKNRLTILYDYPLEFASLSKPNTDGKTAQRFEFFINGIELGNCFSELTEVELQAERFKKDTQERKENGMYSVKVDNGFIDELKNGLPESTGIAIGLERLACIFLELDSIQKLKLITFEQD